MERLFQIHFALSLILFKSVFYLLAILRLVSRIVSQNCDRRRKGYAISSPPTYTHYFCGKEIGPNKSGFGGYTQAKTRSCHRVIVASRRPGYPIVALATTNYGNKTLTTLKRNLASMHQRVQRGHMQEKSPPPCRRVHFLSKQLYMYSTDKQYKTCSSLHWLLGPVVGFAFPPKTFPPRPEWPK